MVHINTYSKMYKFIFISLLQLIRLVYNFINKLKRMWIIFQFTYLQIQMLLMFSLPHKITDKLVMNVVLGRDQIHTI